MTRSRSIAIKLTVEEAERLAAEASGHGMKLRPYLRGKLLEKPAAITCDGKAILTELGRIRETIVRLAAYPTADARGIESDVEVVDARVWLAKAMGGVLVAAVNGKGG